MNAAMDKEDSINLKDNQKFLQPLSYLNHFYPFSEITLDRTKTAGALTSLNADFLTLK